MKSFIIISSFSKCVGDKQEDLVANQFPIHAAKDGDDFRSPNYEKSTNRNCHNGKGNRYSGDEWVDYVRIYRQTLGIDYSNNLFSIYVKLANLVFMFECPID
jgi:hypothetical protein